MRDVHRRHAWGDCWGS